MVNQIIEKLVPGEAKDFNLERLDGKSCSGAQIVTAVQSLPFMGERRVVVVQSTEELAAADGRLVGETLSQLPSSMCLLFLYEGKANLREEIPAQVSSLGSIVTFWPPFANQLPSWVVGEAKRRGKTISFDAANLIAQACADLQLISNELDKLCLFIGPKKSIEVVDVRNHGLPDELGDYKDLEEALWNRNLAAALNQGQLLAELGIRGEAIFPVCERVFRTLLLAHYYRREKKLSWDDIHAALYIRGKTYQSNLSQGLKLYTETELRQSFELISQADYDLKTGVLPSSIAVTMLLLRLCGKQASTLSAQQRSY